MTLLLVDAVFPLNLYCQQNDRISIQPKLRMTQPLVAMKAESLGAQLRNHRGSLYLKIATALRRDIETGVWPPGHQLPSLERVAADFGVAVVTARQAVTMLEGEGLLQRFHGKGTFVTDSPKVGQSLLLQCDWSSLLKHLGGKKSTLIHGAQSEGVPHVGPEEGELAPAYQYMRRVHHADGRPYAVVDIYLEQQTYLRNKKRFDEEMVISTLEEMKDIELENLHQTVAFTTADSETASLLNVPINSPIGDVRRIITDVNKTILYVGETKYRGDYVKLDMNIKRG